MILLPFFSVPKFRYSFFSILFLLLFSHTILASFNIYATIVKALPRTAQAISFTGSVFFPLADALLAYNRPIQKQQLENQKLKPAPAIVDNWIRSYLQQFSVANPEMVNIWVANKDWCVAGAHDLICPESIILELNKALHNQLNQEKSEYFFLETKIALAHEAAHIIHNDNSLRQKILPCFALLTTGLFDGAIKTSCANLFQQTLPRSAILSAIYLSSFPAKWYITYTLQGSAERAIEQRADNFALTKATLSELECWQKLFQQRHDLLRENYNNPEAINIRMHKSFIRRYQLAQKLHQLSRSNLQLADWCEQHPWLLRFVEYAHHNGHPTDFDRLKHVEKKLAKRM